MLQKQTILDQIEIKVDGTIFMRLLKQVVDGDVVLFSEPHRSVIEPGTSVDNQMSAVNASLVELGYPSVSADHVKRIGAHVQLAHTKETIESFKKNQEAFAPIRAQK